MKELLLQGTQSRYAEYRMKAKSLLLLTIAVTVKYVIGRRGKHSVKNLGYVVSNLHWNPRRVHKIYQSRFSIESSYRMKNQVKSPTSTNNPVIRYHYAIISLPLKNIWAALL